MLRVLFEEYQIPVRNSASACIRAENNPQVSITYKTLHLLNALKYDGVMPAITNIIIRTFFNRIKDSSISEIDISQYKKYIIDIQNDYQHINNEFRPIHELAFKLWKAALLCKDYKIPREIARKAIQNISIKSWNPNGVTIDIETYSDMQKEFRQWTQEWQYKKGSPGALKVKVLFINLLKTKFNDSSDELIFDKAPYTLITEKIELDHMEANKPNSSNMAKHFTPVDPHEMREKYTNALGNFMILDSDNNNEKNNRPLFEAIHFYENMCQGHWINKETRDLLSKHHIDVAIGDTLFPVPTEQFFNERRSRLRRYFEKIILRDLDANKIRI